MLFFKKKKKEEQQADNPEENTEPDPNAEPEVPVAAPPERASETGDLSLGKLTADVEKLKAQFTTFYELQKTTSERFSRINEQIGELRSMMIERDKSAQLLEAKATQAIDLVKTVQPDKLMIEMRKSDSKIEALRANLESTENIINNVVNELKEVKNKIMLFRGVEQVISLEEEAKKELLDVKKIQAIVERHADKVETIFTEMQKKFSDFAKFNDTVKDLDKSFKQISSEFDSIKIKISDLASKKEVENLISKFDDFEKYTSNIIKLINNKFEKLQKELSGDFNKKFQETDKLLQGFQILAQKTPDLDKYFNLLSEEAKKAAQQEVKVEKIKELGAEDTAKEPAAEESGGLLGKFKGLAGRFKK
ncbi:hypothetical protein HYY70_02400 [Candidatus Woesearchaeota archaeon]|nr:hypothetical protein [Candidatus Woesearchaeota archaeon]